ncbi:PIR protein [Plasmodium ovale]|uniref:PIR protein n=1 Tax=Plasmodium ovale TaxID=36330 RepID=A0A1D3JEC6_PLAOA|nr:PIR protein [Plasmodium ovale]
MSAYVLGKDHLEYLTSKRYYKNLKESKNYCSEEKIVTLKDNLQRYLDNNGFSKEVIGALCLTSFKNEIDSDCREHCNYIYFWIVHTLINVLKKEEKISNIIDTINGISQAFVETHKCKCNFSKNFNKDNFNKIKAVHDYFNDYAYINEKLNESRNLCDETYKNYLETTYSVYETAYKDCISHNSQTYCSELKEKIPKFNENKLQLLSCEKTEQEIIHSPPGRGYDLDSEEVRETSFSESTPTTSIFLSIFLPFLGICFFLLYKFTPFGSWMKNNIVKKSTVKSYLNKIRTHDLRGYNSGSDQIHFEDGQFNLNYLSS